MAIDPSNVAKNQVAREQGIDTDCLKLKSQKYKGKEATIVLVDDHGNEYIVHGTVTPPPLEMIKKGLMGGEKWDMTVEPPGGEQNG